MNWELVNKLRRLRRTSLIKTLIINFSMLPFRQAICLPILVTKYTYFYSLSGKIILKDKAKLGMIRFGYFGEDCITPSETKTLLQIEGIWELSDNVHLGNGVIIRIEPNARLSIQNNVRISNKTKIICYDNITIGPNTRIAWECQIIDTTFHYMKNVVDGSISELTKPVVIGAHNWIGNRTNIMKGAWIPDFTIVASGSLCNKCYDIPSYSLLAGTPAKVVKTGIYRCLDSEELEIKRRKQYENS